MIIKFIEMYCRIGVEDETEALNHHERSVSILHNFIETIKNPLENI